MDIQTILSKVDHTNLAVDATWADIKTICDDGLKYQTASVCIPSGYVKEASEYIAKQSKALALAPIPVCTVIGFPNGYVPTSVKAFEAAEAVKNGAEEIDMVIFVGALKDKRYDYILNDIKEVKKACGDKILKVIIETCLLTDEEKIKMCELVGEAGADFIKTSTGFSKGGATFEDIQIFAEHVQKPVQIKAAGGISSIEDAEKFVELGADRLGTSRIVKIVKSKE